MSSDSTSGRSPRRELQGPRPAPLKVRKDSHKIRKPPVAPQPPPQPHLAPPRPPVIIYTVSPKIIHANPNEFMSLVQRLTGPNSSSSSAAASTSPSTSAAYDFQEHGGAISPAARFASIEKTRSPEGRKSITQQGFDDSIEMIEGLEIGTELIQRTGQFPGILSPNPNTLPPIPPNFFSPPSDNINNNPNNNINNNPFNFFHDFSPMLHSNRNNYSENNYILPSPNFFSPQINMPSPNTLDLFNTLFDL